MKLSSVFLFAFVFTTISGLPVTNKLNTELAQNVTSPAGTKGEGVSQRPSVDDIRKSLERQKTPGSSLLESCAKLAHRFSNNVLSTSFSSMSQKAEYRRYPNKSDLK